MIPPDSPWLTVLLAALTMVTALAFDMVLPAMPALEAALHATPDRVQLTLSLFFIGFGLVFPNATVAAMERLPHIAGTASAMLGAMQMAGAGLSGYAVNALYDGTPVAMGGVLAAMAVLSFSTYHLWVKRR